MAWTDRIERAVFAAADAERIPRIYAKALSLKESNHNPLAKSGKHWGLFQVSPEVLADYNAAHPSRQVARDHLLRPEENARVAMWTLRRIANAYHHTGLTALRENWRAANWVALLTAGWNSGWSKRAGVIAVAHLLDSEGIPATHENVFARMRDGAKRPPWYRAPLWTDKKERWQRSVAAAFVVSSMTTPTTKTTTRGNTSWLILLALVALAMR